MATLMLRKGFCFSNLGMFLTGIGKVRSDMLRVFRGVCNWRLDLGYVHPAAKTGQTKHLESEVFLTFTTARFLASHWGVAM